MPGFNAGSQEYIARRGVSPLPFRPRIPVRLHLHFTLVIKSQNNQEQQVDTGPRQSLGS